MKAINFLEDVREERRRNLFPKAMIVLASALVVFCFYKAVVSTSDGLRLYYLVISAWNVGNIFFWKRLDKKRKELGF